MRECVAACLPLWHFVENPLVALAYLAIDVLTTQLPLAFFIEISAVAAIGHIEFSADMETNRGVMKLAVFANLIFYYGWWGKKMVCQEA